MNTKIVSLVSIIAIILAHECYGRIDIREGIDRDLDMDKPDIISAKKDDTAQQDEIKALSNDDLLAREARQAAEVQAIAAVAQAIADAAFLNKGAGETSQSGTISAEETDTNQIEAVDSIDANNFYKTVDISNSRKLLETFKQLIDNINAQLIRYSESEMGAQISKEVETINGNISNLLVGVSSEIDAILKENKDIILDIQQDGPIKQLYAQISRTMSFYRAKNPKTTHLNSFENYRNHPVMLVMKYFQYFVEFSYNIYKTNEYLKQHEKTIRDFYNTSMNLYTEVGGEIPVDQAGMIKVGSNIRVEQGIGKNARGAQSKTSVGINSSIKAGVGAVAIKGSLGGVYTKQKDAVGMKSSNQMINLAGEVKKILNGMPMEYKTFSDQRSIVDGFAKELGANLSGLQKLFNMYSNATRVTSSNDSSSTKLKIVYTYIDPKNNLEKSKSLELKKSVKLSSPLSKLLSSKLEFNSKGTIHTKDRNVYDLISKIDFSHLLGDYDSFKKMAILFKKYDVIKKAYSRDGELDVFVLKDLFESHCKKKFIERSILRPNKKSDSIVSFSEFVATVSYYAEILENLSAAKIGLRSKEEIKQYRNAKQEIEKKFATNGRAKTFAEMYFMGIGYLVLGLNEQESDGYQQANSDLLDTKSYIWKIAELKNSYEKIALFLPESKNKSKKAMESIQCFSAENEILLEVADGLFSFVITNVSNSPYIFENGFEVTCKINISKFDKVAKKINQLKKVIKMGDEIVDKIQLFLSTSDKDILKKIAILIECLGVDINTIKQVLIDEIKKRWANMSSSRIAWIVDSLMMKIIPKIHDIFLQSAKNEQKIRVNSNAINMILMMLGSKKSSELHLKFKIFVKDKLDVQFLGSKVMNSITNEFSAGTTAVVSGTPIETTFKIGMKRSADGGFVYRNSSSIFLIIKDIVDYCFIREADFGEELKESDIKKFLRSIYRADYLNEVYRNYKENRLTNELLRLKDAIMEDSYSVYSNVNTLQNSTDNEQMDTSNSEEEFIDMLARYGIYMFKDVAKPYNERAYTIRNGTKTVRW